MAEAAGAGAAITFGSSVLQAYGSAESTRATAEGKAREYEFKAQQAERQARAARTAADQTDAFLRDELTTTLGNIEAIRAAGGVAAGSPTSEAILAREEDVSERQRRIKVGNIKAQAAESEEGARFYRDAATRSLKAADSADLGFFGSVLGGLGRAMSRF